ncbi:MAG: hypothetical protein C5B49_09410 [Bdellovibrio sp.]|nr:MAG: hypothetical protein C5B49_09410 [Bdellovibrio sp.]
MLQPRRNRQTRHETMRSASAVKSTKIVKPAKPTVNVKTSKDVKFSSLSLIDPFAKKHSRSQLQQIRIIEAAIESFANRGIEATTYARLARDCNISRPLIHHYFPTLASLFLMAAKHIRRSHLEAAMFNVKKAGPEAWDQLKAFVEGSFDWIEQHPNYAKFWLLYYYQCGLGGAIASEHTALVKAGEESLQSILSGFNLRKSDDPYVLTKSIQMTAIGGTLSALTESRHLPGKKAREITLSAIASILRGHRLL